MIDLDLPALRALAFPEPSPADAPSDGDARAALDAVRASACKALRENAHDWTDAALAGLGRMEAEGALIDLDIDPDDAPAGLMAALVAEFVGAFRAC